MVLQSKINTNQTWGLISKSIKLLNLLFESNPNKEVPLAKASNLFIEKYKSRFQESQQFEYLRQLLSFKNLYINGEQFPNFNFYVSKIAKDEKLKTSLTPKLYGVIHGDLHCGNILVKDNNVYFVDPNGNLSMPIEYDYGKILHSIHGGYGSIMNGNYKLTELGKNRFEFLIKIPKAYKISFGKLSKTMPLELLIRSLYAKAMHFATMLPHHAKNEEETKALFLKGVMLFKELFSFLKSD